MECRMLYVNYFGDSVTLGGHHPEFTGEYQCGKSLRVTELGCKPNLVLNQTQAPQPTTGSGLCSQGLHDERPGRAYTSERGRFSSLDIRALPDFVRTSSNTPSPQLAQLPANLTPTPSVCSVQRKRRQRYLVSRPLTQLPA